MCLHCSLWMDGRRRFHQTRPPGRFSRWGRSTECNTPGRIPPITISQEQRKFTTIKSKSRSSRAFWVEQNTLIFFYHATLYTEIRTNSSVKIPLTFLVLETVIQMIDFKGKHTWRNRSTAITKMWRTLPVKPIRVRNMWTTQIPSENLSVPLK